MARVIPDEMFLEAFDETIEKVFHRLASQGVADDAIWEGFLKATIAMGSLALDVENAQLPADDLKVDVRIRRSLGARRSSYPFSSSVCRCKSKE